MKFDMEIISRYNVLKYVAYIIVLIIMDLHS